jgi:hypothetical protein
MEQVQIDIGVVRACATQCHVAGILGECLHGRDLGALAVTMRVASIEGTIVVEHASTVDACNI